MILPLFFFALTIGIYMFVSKESPSEDLLALGIVAFAAIFWLLVKIERNTRRD